MRNKIKITVSLRLNADDWHIYKSEPHPESVARQMNLEISRAINESDNWFDAFCESEKTLVKFKHYGANESEPRAVLEQILTYVFREE